MIQTIYKELYRTYGPQGWWPIQGTYDGRTPDKEEQLEICIGAILTQNTAWKNVEKALRNLSPITEKKLASLSDDELREAIRPAGYFNQKCKKLRVFLSFLKKNKDPSREQLLQLWGIGPETADSILLYAYGKPEFVIDAYTRRLFTMLGIIKGEESYEEIKQQIETSLPKDPKLFKEYHALIVEHGKRYYSKKPYTEPLLLHGNKSPLLGHHVS